MTREQRAATDSLFAHETGVSAAASGFGKTVVAALMIAERGVKTLILVHRRQLMMQWIARLGVFLDLTTSAIGRAGGRKRKLSGVIDVATLQSLERKNVVDDLVADYRHLVVDECHHLSAVSFEVVARRARARYVLGLSATIMRKEHAGELAGKIGRFARNVLLFRGGMEERAPRDHAAPGRHTRRRGAGTGRDRPLYRREIRRCPPRHAVPRDARVVAGNAGPALRPPAPAPFKKTRRC